jgi:hypothetical protein
MGWLHHITSHHITSHQNPSGPYRRTTIHPHPSTPTSTLLPPCAPRVEIGLISISVSASASAISIGIYPSSSLSSISIPPPHPLETRFPSKPKPKPNYELCQTLRFTLPYLTLPYLTLPYRPSAPTKLSTITSTPAAPSLPAQHLAFLPHFPFDSRTIPKFNSIQPPPIY